MARRFMIDLAFRGLPMDETEERCVDIVGDQALSAGTTLGEWAGEAGPLRDMQFEVFGRKEAERVARDLCDEIPNLEYCGVNWDPKSYIVYCIWTRDWRDLWDYVKERLTAH
jgi:hypothetical protein